MRIAPCLVLLALAVGASAQPQEIVDKFERRSIESNGVTMSYGLFVPEDYDPDVEYPLVVAFHGLGESGTDLKNLRAHRLATSWADPDTQAEHPAFVLAPQTLVGRRWTTDQDPDESDFVAVQLAVLDILDLVEDEFSIDADRVYAVGLSLGGHATWDFVSRLPDRFAAAVPMSGRGFPSQADDLGDLPIWAFTGETDTVVPPSQTRRVIQALEDLGRDVIYTHCRRSPVEARAFDCPGYIGQDSLAAAIDAHATLIYTSEPTVGHGPWAPWFDHPLLAPWLFSQVRQDPDAIAVVSPAAGARWDGTRTVTWTTTRATDDVVEVWLNRTDDPADWQKLGEAPISAGAFALDTEALADAALARVRLFVRNADGRIAGRATSARFAIDNPGNAAPELRLRDEGLRFDPRILDTMYGLGFVVADAEDDALSGSISYSIDGGETYVTVLTIVPEILDPYGSRQSLTVDLRPLPNSRTARFRIDITDGTNTVSAETPVFLKQTPREATGAVEQVQGEGEGSVELRVVDEDALTGHRYRITVDATGEAKTYAVTDLDDGAVVLSGVPLSDGVQESPVFDGLTLVVEDLAEGRADLDATGWVEGDTDLGVTVSGGSVRIAILTVDLLATETDYEVTVTDDVVGQSIRLHNIPVTDLRFTVTGDDGQPRDVVFADANDDGLPGDGDVLYIVEPDADGEPALAWKLEFSATDATVLPEPGDVFRLVPVRSLGAGDVFEFEGRLGTAVLEAPRGGLALQTYPNPSAGPITLAYQLGAAADVRIEVFDARGRLITTLADGPASAGGHRTTWSADAASGVFLVRLTARTAGGASESVRQSVVLIRR
ncbi:alpha/beta hydrolase-fold protein [Rubrivirga sp.]|uniref:alpha/beta hydrolase-fold protein n=1 Tax=Rubrivirga sp. TaxID=1885344 RepID=UPI003B527EAF